MTQSYDGDRPPIKHLSTNQNHKNVLNLGISWSWVTFWELLKIWVEFLGITYKSWVAFLTNNCANYLTRRQSHDGNADPQNVDIFTMEVSTKHQWTLVYNLRIECASNDSLLWSKDLIPVPLKLIKFHSHVPLYFQWPFHNIGLVYHEGF